MWPFSKPKDTDWTAFVDLREKPPVLKMRRRVNGEWEYRKPTAEEEADYVSADAW